MTDVWLHHSGTFWYVTDDGLHAVDRVESIVLRRVRFIIDPIGQERARRLRRKVTHAWAVGERCDDPLDVNLVALYQEQHGILKLSYQWWRSENFTIGDQPVLCADYAALHLNDDGSPQALAWGPVYGVTERREVQQYGRETRKR